MGKKELDETSCHKSQKRMRKFSIFSKLFLLVVLFFLTSPGRRLRELISPHFTKTPKKGDKIGQYTVTSPWGPRNLGIAGASTFHQGVDLNTPVGTPLYAIGKSGAFVDVQCWTDQKGGGLVASYKSLGISFDYLHLSKCYPGKQPTGAVIALSGASGLGSGPHFHFQQRNVLGKKVPPQAKYIEWSLQGRE